MEPEMIDSAVEMGVTLGPVCLENPILAASGTYGFGEEYGTVFDLRCLGGLITKTITTNPRDGNRPPRLVESAAGLINSIGLTNPGLDVFMQEQLPLLSSVDVPLVVSIAGESMDEYVSIVSRLEGEDAITALEINISCPNVDLDGEMISAHPDLVQSLAIHLRQVTSHPLIFKLSPQIGTVVASAQAARNGGADILSLVNTFPALAIDADMQRPILGNVVGGLSGPAIKPIALRLIWDVARKVDLPIIASGGIFSARDVVEFALAGANAVSIGTANFVDPLACIKILADLRSYLHKRGITVFSDIIGKLKAE